MEVTCNFGCHPQHEGLRVCTVGAVRGNKNVTLGLEGRVITEGVTGFIIEGASGMNSPNE